MWGQCGWRHDDKVMSNISSTICAAIMPQRFHFCRCSQHCVLARRHVFCPCSASCGSQLCGTGLLWNLSYAPQLPELLACASSKTCHSRSPPDRGNRCSDPLRAQTSFALFAFCVNSRFCTCQLGPCRVYASCNSYVFDRGIKHDTVRVCRSVQRVVSVGNLMQASIKSRPRLARLDSLVLVVISCFWVVIVDSLIAMKHALIDLFWFSARTVFLG